MARAWFATFVAGMAFCAALGAEAPPERGLSAGTMAYVLQANALGRTRAEAVKQLAGSGRDLVVMDYAYEGGAEGKWTRDEIETIRQGKAKRRVAAYLSIGEAEDYRPYWHKEWDADGDGKPDPGAPPFLAGENPDWKGNYKVRYWESAWQRIILGYLDEIIEQGFDGVYLDIVDGFEFFEQDGKQWIDNRKNPETGKTYRRDMVEWVAKIADRGRRKRPALLVIPQNGAQLLEHPDYLERIDAIGIEDLFTVGNKKQTRADSDYLLGFLKRMPPAKPVFLIEYGTSLKAREFSMAEARRNSLNLLLTDRDLKTLGESYPSAAPP